MTAHEPTVYRVYNKDDGLIYVGSTKNFEKRLQAHKQSSWWFGLADRFDLDWYPNMVQAHEAETRAIETEAPAFNLNSLGTTRPGSLALTDDELTVCREWIAANPGRAAKLLPQSLSWVLDFSQDAAA